jgi:hypothetical protein
MGFKEFLLNMIPHRWLDPLKAGTQRLFGGLGAVLDIYDSMVKKIEQESSVRTAVDTLGTRETEYGIPVDPSMSLEGRRTRLIVRMREGAAPITKPEFEASLSILFGSSVRVITVLNEPYMTIEFEEVGNSIDFNVVEDYIRRNKRAHVGHGYSSKTKDSIQLVDTISANMKRYHTVSEFRVGMTPIKEISGVKL